MVGTVPVVVMRRLSPVQHGVFKVSCSPVNRSCAHERGRLPRKGEHNQADEEAASHRWILPWY
jgi:hypothetical protein